MSGIQIKVYATNHIGHNVRFVQGTVGDSDLISLSITNSGKETFSMSPGCISRKEGSIYKAFKDLLQGNT